VISAVDDAASWRPTAKMSTLRLRAAMLARARGYFAATDALEVETPALVRAPVTDVHLESLRVTDDVTQATQGFLQTSPEYDMKRLLCAGAPDIYQICRVFRAAERGRRHNPEFTMIEWYRLGIDDQALMRDVESFVRTLLEPHREIAPSLFISYQRAFERVLEIEPLHAPVSQLRTAIETRGVPVPDSMRTEARRDDLLELAMSTLVAESFARDRLTFVHDFPASQAALARVHGEVAARFEAFWGPVELANGFHELGVADEQRARFECDRAERRAAAQPDREPDLRFLDALQAGLPDCAGVALGFDRLLMIAIEAERIDEVIAFPFERA
jgi:lysyl-tRNA synthetase class 2